MLQFNVFRYLLHSNDSALVSLRQELDFVKAYLHIVTGRFEDALSVTIAIPDDFLNFRLPPVALQLLLENAIRHNALSAAYPLEIRKTRSN